MNADSIKARLKNKSQATGKTLQELLVAYGLERTIYRISKSRYSEMFTLKGGIFLYALFDGEFVRATTDIDLLANRIDNDPQRMKAVFAEIFSMMVDDPLRFDINTLNVKGITEFKEYHGVNVSITAYLDRTKIAISIDIGFGDIIYPDRVLMDFPVILNDECPRIYAYSIYSCISEKFEAIVSLGYDNSRFKDFYDLYVLSNQYDLNGHELLEAVKETFSHRRTGLNDIVAFDKGFSDDTLRRTRWNAFVKRKKAMLPISLEDTIDAMKQLLQPIIVAIQTDSDFSKTWHHDKHQWI